MDDDEESVGLELELDALNPSSLTRKELSFGLGRGGRNDLDDDDGQSRRYSRPGKWKPCCARPWVPADHAPPLLTIPPYDILPTLILPPPAPAAPGLLGLCLSAGERSPSWGNEMRGAAEQRKTSMSMIMRKKKKNNDMAYDMVQ